MTDGLIGLPRSTYTTSGCTTIIRTRSSAGTTYSPAGWVERLTYTLPNIGVHGGFKPLVVAFLTVTHPGTSTPGIVVDRPRPPALVIQEEIPPRLTDPALAMALRFDAGVPSSTSRVVQASAPIPWESLGHASKTLSS